MSDNNHKQDAHPKLTINPQKQLRALFEYSLTWYKNKLFHGCMAVHAMNEYMDKNDEIVAACQKFKDKQLSFIAKLVKQANLKNPDKLAYELFVVMEGITVVSSRSKGCSPENPVKLFNKIISDV